MLSGVWCSSINRNSETFVSWSDGLVRKASLPAWLLNIFWAELVEVAGKHWSWVTNWPLVAIKLGASNHDWNLEVVMLGSLRYSSGEYRVCSGGRIMIGTRRFRWVRMVGLYRNIPFDFLPDSVGWDRSESVVKNPFYFRPESGRREPVASGVLRVISGPETAVSNGVPTTSRPVPVRIRHSESSTWAVWIGRSSSVRFRQFPRRTNSVLLFALVDHRWALASSSMFNKFVSSWINWDHIIELLPGSVAYLRSVKANIQVDRVP